MLPRSRHASPLALLIPLPPASSHPPRGRPRMGRIPFITFPPFSSHPRRGWESRRGRSGRRGTSPLPPIDQISGAPPHQCSSSPSLCMFHLFQTFGEAEETPRTCLPSVLPATGIDLGFFFHELCEGLWARKRSGARLPPASTSFRC